MYLLLSILLLSFNRAILGGGNKSFVLMFDGNYKISLSNLDEFVLTNITTPTKNFVVFPNSSVQITNLKDPYGVQLTFDNPMVINSFDNSSLSSSNSTTPNTIPSSTTTPSPTTSSSTTTSSPTIIDKNPEKTNIESHHHPNKRDSPENNEVLYKKEEEEEKKIKRRRYFNYSRTSTGKH